VRVALHPEVVVHVSVNVARSADEAELQANPDLAAAVAESEREAERLEREAEEAEQAPEAPRLVLPE
jgi:large subunit ribosomal protein L9